MTADPKDHSIGNAADITHITNAFQGNQQVRVDVLNQATRKTLSDKLLSFRPHVLYMVAHGAKNEPSLILTGDDGNSLPIEAEKLAGFIPKETRLVILDSCHTADGRLSSIAPYLVQRGIPAVLGMQFAMPSHYGREFMQILFQELVRHGNIEDALRIARTHGYGRIDNKQEEAYWLIPALFMNSDTGQLWTTQSEGDEETDRARRIYAYPEEHSIEEFLVEYLGAKNSLVPFGGRDTELQQLNHWLDDDTAPDFGLMVAGAGGGKSALLVNWLVQLKAQRSDIETLFFPISFRFDTTRQVQFFSYLNRKLANLYGETANMDAIRDPTLQRAQF